MAASSSAASVVNRAGKPRARSKIQMSRESFSATRRLSVARLPSDESRMSA
jgi:hypothetical protein